MDRKTSTPLVHAETSTDPAILIARAKAMQAETLARIFHRVATAPLAMVRLIRQAVADRKHGMPRTAG